MTQAGTSVAAAAVAPRPGVTRRLVRHPLGVVSLAILAVIAIAAVVGPLIEPFNPSHADLANAFAAPGHGHLLGTDSAGRDVLSRLLAGSRDTLLAALLAAGVAMVLGVPTGLVAGFYGGFLDSLFNWASNVLLSLPAVVVLLAVSAVVGKTVWVSMTVFGVLMAPGFYRLTQAMVCGVRNELYVDAARVAGLSDTKIIGRHIISVVRAPLIIQASIIGGIAIAIQASLEFLGLGDPGVPSWGGMLNEAFTNLYNAPILTLWPGLAITLAIGAFILLGNALRDALEDSPKTARRPRSSAPPASPSGDVEPGLALQLDPSSHGSHLLSVSGLCVGYARADGSVSEVLSGVSFEIDRGEVVGIVGESGSGKTQTAFSILGLLPDGAVMSGGGISWKGEPLVQHGHQRSFKELGSLRGRAIGYVPQEPMSNLDPNFTIGHQLTRPLVKVAGLGRRDAVERSLELLATVGITEPRRVFAAYPHQISGGMAQRVLIAGAVGCEPDLLIADEPTTALDVTVQAEVLDLLRDLQDRLRMGVLLVTHDFGVVADLCERVLVMQHGVIVESGDVRTIMRAPSHRYTQELLSATLAGKEPLTILAGGSRLEAAPSGPSEAPSDSVRPGAAEGRV